MCNGLVHLSARCLRSQGLVFLGGFVVVGGFSQNGGAGVRCRPSSQQAEQSSNCHHNSGSSLNFEAESAPKT